MADMATEVLSAVRTVEDMIEAFRDEEHCRRLLEAMIWPNGRICPSCGYKRSLAIAGRDMGKKRARPGLYQCGHGDCRYQFTVTTRTPLHSTKLPLRLWLKALWLILQSDKGLSSVRLAEALGVSQPTAWRMGHALRLLMANEAPLGGIVEVDALHIGGKPRKDAERPKRPPGRRSQAKTTKFPALALVQRPSDTTEGSPAGSVRTGVVTILSTAETRAVMNLVVDPAAHLMSDEWRAFIAAGSDCVAHDTVCHSKREHVRGLVHVNSAEGFNARVRQTVAGVFHHISPQHADLYLTEIGFRWSQRIVSGQAVRRTRKGREVVRTLWERVAPALQFLNVFKVAVGRQLRRTANGSITIKSTVAVFG